MFEDVSPSINMINLIIICILYVFGSIAVGIISQQIKLRFVVGFVWSIVFTPIVGLFLVFRNNPSKKIFRKQEVSE